MPELVDYLIDQVGIWVAAKGPAVSVGDPRLETLSGLVAVLLRFEDEPGRLCLGKRPDPPPVTGDQAEGCELFQVGIDRAVQRDIVRRYDPGFCRVYGCRQYCQRNQREQAKAQKNRGVHYASFIT